MRDFINLSNASKNTLFPLLMLCGRKLVAKRLPQRPSILWEGVLEEPTSPKKIADVAGCQ